MIASFVLARHKLRIASTLSNGNIIRIQPAVSINESQVMLMITALNDAFDLISKADSGNLISHIIAPQKFQETGRTDFSESLEWLKEEELEGIDKRVTFIATPSSSRDMVDIDPSLERFTEAEIDIFVNLIQPLGLPVRLPGRVMESKTGEKIVFYLISIPYVPSMIMKLYMTKNLGQVNGIVNQLVAEAISKGHVNFGLGSFTSVITNNGQDIHTNKIGVTTGNSLTVVSSAEAIFKVADDEGISNEGYRLGIIGATGNIGSMYAQYASSKCKEIYLIGRENSEPRLINTANNIYRQVINDPSNSQELYDVLIKGLGDEGLSQLKEGSTDSVFTRCLEILGDDAPVKISTNLDSVKQCNIIICTTNSTNKILFSHMIGEHKTIISDVSFPPDVDQSVFKMDNTIILHGGVVGISSVFDDRFRGIPSLENQEAFACMSETILLGMSGKAGHFSYGALDIEKLYEIKKCASDFDFILNKPKKIMNVFG
jgi:predicted amino acid dehydrogenase